MSHYAPTESAITVAISKLASAFITDWALAGQLNDGYAGYSSLLRSGGGAGKEEFLVLVETGNYGEYSGNHMAPWLQRFSLA